MESQTDFLDDDAYRRLFDYAGDAIFVLDAEGNFLAVNQTACDHVGYTREELLTMRPEQINVPEDADAFAARLARVNREKRATIEAVHIHRDGHRIPVEIHVRKIRHHERDLFIALCRDVSVRKQNELEYRSIIQAAGDGYWAVRVKDACIIDVNETFCEMLGYSREELLSMRVPDLEVIESPEETAAHIRKVIEQGHDLFETKHRRKDGSIVNVEVSASYADARGGVIFVFQRDITERKRQEADQKLAALTFSESTAAIVITDAENFIVAVNPAFTRISGYEADEAIGRNPRFLQSGRQNRSFYRAMWSSLQQTGHWEGEWWNQRKDGTEYAEQVVMNVVRDSDGKVYRYVKISSDITEKKRLDDLVWRQAHYDALTELPNRPYFLDSLSESLQQNQRLALYFIDLDGFKQVNDQFGHDIGDRVLIEASRRIVACVRSTDMVARLGGDEFTIILSGISDTLRVESVAQKVVATLAEPFTIDDIEVSISASVGIAVAPEHGRTAVDLMRQADQAMYSSKNTGKNIYRFAG